MTRLPILVCFVTPMLLFCFAADAVAQSGDFNGDAMLDCQDADLISFHIRTGTNDPTYDLTADGVVDVNDLDLWVERHFVRGDVTLDGYVDHEDAHIVGLNWFRPGITSYCQGDIDMDGATTPLDREYVAMSWRYPDAVPHEAAGVILGEIPDSLAAWRTEQGVPFARAGSVELVAVPQRAPDGVLATVVAARATEPGHRIVTVYNQKMTGDLHQTWTSFSFAGETVRPEDVEPSATYAAEWGPYDSHLLTPGNTVGASFGAGYHGILETNDATDPLNINDELPLASTFAAATGIGDLKMSFPSDTYFFDSPFQSEFVALAYLVTPAVMPDDGAVGEVFLTLGILGGDQANQPLPDTGVMGLDEPIRIPFFSEPCDLNADGYCNVTDIDMLLAAFGSPEPSFNLDTANPEIDLGDRDEWLRDAGMADGLEPYALGDADLDGDVDARDLNNLALNWQQSGARGWSGGDFDGNGMVNVADLNLIGLNWQHGVATAAAGAVPEPGALTMCVFAILLAAGRGKPRSSRRR